MTTAGARMRIILGRYLISDTGLIFHVSKLFLPLKTQLCPSGYHRVRIGRRWYRVHVLVAKAFLPKRRRRDMVVAHLDGNKDNNKATNLQWKTKSQNERDKKKHGTAPKGGHRTPTPLDLIKSILSSTDNHSATARKLGLHRSSVARIRAGTRRGSVSQRRAS